jgi:acyl-CoA dehydrogenase
VGSELARQQFPIAQAYTQIRAAEFMTCHASDLFHAGLTCGAETSIAEPLAWQASGAAARACLDTHGGYGFAT